MGSLIRRRFPGMTRWRDIDRAFDELLKEPVAWPDVEFTPSVEFAETDDEFVVTAEIPGIREEDFSVEVDDNMLMIRGEKRAEERRKAKGLEYSERTYGRFARAIQLPSGIDASKVEAVYKNGVLEVHVPKAEGTQRRTIPIGHKEKVELGAGGAEQAAKPAAEKPATEQQVTH